MDGEKVLPVTTSEYIGCWWEALLITQSLRTWFRMRTCATYYYCYGNPATPLELKYSCYANTSLSVDGWTETEHRPRTIIVFEALSVTVDIPFTTLPTKWVILIIINYDTNHFGATHANHDFSNGLEWNPFPQFNQLSNAPYVVN